jgi:hypothetical protein
MQTKQGIIFYQSELSEMEKLEIESDIISNSPIPDIDFHDLKNQGNFSDLCLEFKHRLIIPRLKRY